MSRVARQERDRRWGVRHSHQLTSLGSGLVAWGGSWPGAQVDVAVTSCVAVQSGAGEAA